MFGSALTVNDWVTTAGAGAVRSGSLQPALRLTDSVTVGGDAVWSSVRVNVATPLALVGAVTGPCVPIVNLSTTPPSPSLVIVSFRVAVYRFAHSKFVPDDLVPSVIAVVSSLTANDLLTSGAA